MVTVEVLLSSSPSLSLYVKVSVPHQLASGVYVAVDPETVTDPSFVATIE